MRPDSMPRPWLTPSCSNCRFAGEKRNYDDWPCKRRAPIAVQAPNMGIDPSAFEPRWPVMRGSDWCGEHEQGAGE